MNTILRFLRTLDWRVLLALPVLAILIGILNNLHVPADRRVRWSGEHPALVVEAKPNAERGEWTTDFVAATNAAEASHLPVVMVVLKPGCPSCTRLHDAIHDEVVKAWQKKLGWYFVIANSSEEPEWLAFVKVRNKPPPYVGVYWVRDDGTRVMRNFSAKPGLMGVPKRPFLGLEWMNAVEHSVPEAPGVSLAPKHGKGVQISVKTESERPGLGRVKMSPHVDSILPGQKVIRTAKPSNRGVFVGWRYPDGRIVKGEPRLTLDNQCQAGVYKAVFQIRRVNGRGGAKRSNRGEK